MEVTCIFLSEHYIVPGEGVSGHTVEMETDFYQWVGFPEIHGVDI